MRLKSLLTIAQQFGQCIVIVGALSIQTPVSVDVSTCFSSQCGDMVTAESKHVANLGSCF